MGYSAIKFSKRDQVVRITLNRPEARNAVNPEVIAELTKAAEEIGNSSDVKAVVLTGEGDSFCAGADLKFLQEAMSADLDAAVDFGMKFVDVIIAFSEIPVPTIAMVNGYTCAGGLEMMLACDIAIAADDAPIADIHMNRGMIGGPSMWQLPERIGHQKALEVALTGRWLTGSEAATYGLVLRAVPRERLEDEVEALLEQFRKKSEPLLKMGKRVLQIAPTIPDQREAIKCIKAEYDKYKGGRQEMKGALDAFVVKRGKNRK
jgi:enoyl-CoA hydratase/carnithine racemase